MVGARGRAPFVEQPRRMSENDYVASILDESWREVICYCGAGEGEDCMEVREHLAARRREKPHYARVDSAWRARREKADELPF